MLQPLPESPLHGLLTEAYPSLVTLSDSICSLAFPGSEPVPLAQEGQSNPVFHSLASLLPHGRLYQSSRPKPPLSKEEQKFKTIRWVFIGASAVVLLGYIQLIGFIPAVARALAKSDAGAEEPAEVGESDVNDELEEEGEEEDPPAESSE